MIREAARGDLEGLLLLYTHLHEKLVPADTPERAALWDKILSDPDYHIIVVEEDGLIVSSCVCVIVPNLTHGLRPYALIENVVTHAGYRKRGLASACLDFARELARKQDCYKIMLMTGSKEESTLRFYDRAGYCRGDKTAFNQWL